MNNTDLHDLALDIKAEYLTADLITAYHAPIRHHHTYEMTIELIEPGSVQKRSRDHSGPR